MTEPLVAEPLVMVRGVSKRYGGTMALNGVSIDFRAGEIHGLVGENGAGKSTLTKIVCGRATADAGQLLVQGRPTVFRGPHDATRVGIAAVAQELAVLPSRSVLDNVVCGSEPHWGGFVNRRGALRRYQVLAEQVGLSTDPRRLAGKLPLAEQQKVEIGRALNQGARLIVFDEPTAKLPATDGEHLLELMKTLASAGTCVVFISHFLDEVLATCDRVTVMRDGVVVRQGPASGETADSLIHNMLGRTLENSFPSERAQRPTSPEPVLQAEHVARPPEVRDVSAQVRAGEIVGLCGLVGSGRSEFARAVIGAEKRTGGRVRLNGADLTGTVRNAIDRGLAMIPESRKTQGLQLNRTVLENLTLPHLRRVSRWGFVSRKQERAQARRAAKSVGLPVDKLHSLAAHLSGGNQQKLMFARWLMHAPAIMIVDEPTRGVDVGAKRTIYDLLVQLAESGVGVMLISSELEEITALAHRAVVLRGGRVVATLDGNDIVQEKILPLVFSDPQPQESSINE